ncbi:hypothetical protein ACFX15_039198 [Malus domestica]
MTACILDPSRELGGHHNAQTIGVQITPDAPDIKGAGRLYKDEKAVKQWIFSSFTNVKVKEVPHCEGSSIFPHYHIKTSGIPILLQFAMRTTEDQWSISNALGNVRVLSFCEEFSDSIIAMGFRVDQANFFWWVQSGLLSLE